MREPDDGHICFSIEETSSPGMKQIVGDFIFVRERRLRIHGETFCFAPAERLRLFYSNRHTVPLVLALHELATNAVKYGALAQPKGRIAVTWRVLKTSGAGRLSLEWRETGVPAIDPTPARRGFGLRRCKGGLEFGRARIECGDVGLELSVTGRQAVGVPGAEQLSVGDANGTAPMINLRGGSTCCSGPMASATRPA